MNINRLKAMLKRFIKDDSITPTFESITANQNHLILAKLDFYNYQYNNKELTLNEFLALKRILLLTNTLN